MIWQFEALNFIPRLSAHICVVRLGLFGNWFGLGLIWLHCIVNNRLQIVLLVMTLILGGCVRKIIMVQVLFLVELQSQHGLMRRLLCLWEIPYPFTCITIYSIVFQLVSKIIVCIKGLWEVQDGHVSWVNFSILIVCWLSIAQAV